MRIAGGPQVGAVILAQLKSRLPFRAALLRLKRRLSPYETNPDNDHLALGHGLTQLRLLDEQGIDLTNVRALEVGSGWQPTIPLLFSLAGCREVVLTDVERLMDAALLRRAIAYVDSQAERVAESTGMAAAAIRSRLAAAVDDDFEVMLSRLRMRYFAPADLAELAPGSIDLVLSRAVLEHISERDLQALFATLAETLGPGGAMCHVIDNSDHWEHHDKSLSRLEFLRYGPVAWSLINPPGQAYQNRLRHSEYRRLFEGLGFEILADEGEVWDVGLDALAGMPLAERYRGFEPEDLATITSYIVCRKASVDGG